MNGNSLKAFRESLNLNQTEFYVGLGFQKTNCNVVENHYGNRNIPPALEAAIKVKYPKEYKKCVK